MGNSNSRKTLPIDKPFNLPYPLPTDWPQGGDFASGLVDLGEGLQVQQITSFNKIWRIYEGGADDLGVTFYEPTNIPDGFFMLGCYCQPNNQPFFGWILVAKDNNNKINGDGEEESQSSSSSILVKPTDYTLVWSSAAVAAATGSSKLRTQNGNHGYIWLPVPPNGYRAVGYVVTSIPVKPSPDKVRCVRSDLTDECEAEKFIWGEKDKHGSGVYSSRPRNRGIKAQGVPVGAFTVLDTTTATSTSSSSSSGISCLKNNNFLKFSSMPNQAQVQKLIKAYSPQIYFHSKERFFPSSVNWYFESGALLYTKGQESNPVPIETNGLNLPQGGSNDGNFWMDLPVDENKKEIVKSGDLQGSQAYIHIKPMLGATFTDIAFWIFYPFNGFATAKLGPIDIPLGRIGEHIGDWEHLTLRISNFNGALHKVYFSEHSKGTWIDASLLQFQESGSSSSSNKPVAYSARHGHPFYPKPGLILQGGKRTVGIRNDTERSSMVMDTGSRYSVISGDYLGIAEPAWLNYRRKWGPNITYEIGIEVEKVKQLLSPRLKSAFENLVDVIPNEFYGEEGPLGPKMKNSWDGDER